MSKTVIKVENLSKQYRLGQVGTGTISHDLNRWWHRVRGKEDPYLKIGETNDRASKADSKYVWALQDINFEVKEGEVLGIIGKNGAGKSTLLKILSKVTGPTTGSIKAKGRIASLLEVGTGFHPELTGRENIYLNGTILGMTKAEVKAKLDEIVDFAGVERYLDTPVKRYSSGMMVRLGFAVAAHLDPEILIVDEVLAVGDAEFQKRAIGKMQEVSQGQGRTVLFVSHNMASVEKICEKCILIEKGKITLKEKTSKVINEYLNSSPETTIAPGDLLNLESNFFRKIIFKNNLNEELKYLRSGENTIIHIHMQLNFNLYRAEIRLLFKNKNNQILFLCNNAYSDSKFFIQKGICSVICKIPKLPLPPGIYYVYLTLFEDSKSIESINQGVEIKVIEGDFFNTGKVPFTKDGLYVDHSFSSPIYKV